ncbi:MAG TPA: branched-chain amino acid ABC transporter permease [Deltaproteobacteria bacterium]|nr:branched-chain amino acid ABC transporter permease [Deltaproteobacteria bacterium]
MNLVESYKDDLKLIEKPWTRVWVTALVAGLILMPWFSSEHLVFVFTLIFIYAIGIQGQNILIGYTGQISLGQAGFLAIGAFSFAHFMNVGSPMLLSLIGAGIMAGLAGVLVGFPSLRLKGPYLAIVTLGFGIAVYQLLTSFEFLSGGRMGMVVPRLPELFGMSKAMTMYYFTFSLCVVFTLLTYNLISSYIGRTFIAIRDNEIAAEVMGVNLTRYKLLSFAISSFYTGVHGALYGMLLGFLDPQMFSFQETLTMFVAVVIGGLASCEGALFGAAFVILVPQVFSDFKAMIPVIFGVTVVLIMIFEPMGLAGRWFKFRLYWKNWPFR